MRRLNEYIGKSVKVLSTETKSYIQKGIVGKCGIVYQVKNGSNKIGVVIEYGNKKDLFWFNENEVEINDRYDRNEFEYVAVMKKLEGEEIGIAVNSEFYYELRSFYKENNAIFNKDAIILFEKYTYGTSNHLGFLKGVVNVEYYDKKIEGIAKKIILEKEIANDLRHVLDIDENIDKDKLQIYEQNDSSNPFIFTYDFFLENCNKDMFERKIEGLNGWLEKLGVNFKLRKDKDGYNTLSIDINVGRVRQVTKDQTRNAGRKKKEFSNVSLEGANDITQMTAMDFLKEVEENGVENTKEKYGVSKRTIYRYVNKAKEDIDKNNKPLVTLSKKLEELN